MELHAQQIKHVFKVQVYDTRRTYWTNILDKMRDKKQVIDLTIN